VVPAIKPAARLTDHRQRQGITLLDSSDDFHNALNDKLLALLAIGEGTVSLPALREKFAFPVVGVVPAIKPAARLTANGIVGDHRQRQGITLLDSSDDFHNALNDKLLALLAIGARRARSLSLSALWKSSLLSSSVIPWRWR
jgi:hypothetical protein